MTTQEPAVRLDFAQVAPDIYRAIIALDQAATDGLDPVLVHLVKIRASQINHCAFCISMHTKEARAAGESEERIYLLSAWAEAPSYTERERAALALTEAVTVLTDGFVPDAVYQRAAKQFEERELAQLIALVFTINTWNRLAVSTRKVPA